MTSRKRIQREKETAQAMVNIYCNEKHGGSTLCKDCKKLLDYSHKRLDSCKFGEEKGTCKDCSTHCYKKPQRTKMKEVMGFAGPKMISTHPVLAVQHIADGVEGFRYKVYLVVLVLTMFTFLISWSTLLLNVGVLFFILIFINDRKYKDLEWSRLTPYDRIVGIVLVLIPFILFSIGYFANTKWPEAEFGSFDFLLVVLGVTLVFWGGKGSFRFALPFIAGAAMVVIWYLVDTSLFVNNIGPPFIRSSTVITGGVLEFVGYEVKRQASVLILPGDINVKILVWCSGINGVVLFSFLMILMIWSLNLKAWQKVLVVLGGAVVQYFVNILRLVILLVIAMKFDLDVMETFHSGLGDLLFVLFFGIVYVGVLWWSGRGESEQKSDDT